MAHERMNSYQEQKDDLLNRLKRIEGQIKGIQKMIQDDKYCVDVLTQVAAAKAAINKVGGMLLKSHAMGCVKGAVLSDDKEKSSEMIDELVDVVLKFMK